MNYKHFVYIVCRPLCFRYYTSIQTLLFITGAKSKLKHLNCLFVRSSYLNIRLDFGSLFFFFQNFYIQINLCIWITIKFIRIYFDYEIIDSKNDFFLFRSHIFVLCRSSLWKLSWESLPIIHCIFTI